MSQALLLVDALEGAWLENQRDVSVDEVQTELRRLDALVKEQAAEIERLRAGATKSDTQAKTVADHIEQRLQTWRQRHMNRDGDCLSLEDFMDEASLDDLKDFVCDEYAIKAALLPRCAASHVCDCQEAGVPCQTLERAQRVPLTEDQIDAKRYRLLRAGIKFDWPVTMFPTPPWCVRLEVDHGFPVSKLIDGAALDVAIDAAIEAAHGIHPLQRLADLSKEIGEKL